MEATMSPQLIMNAGTILVAIALAWGAARMGARYEGKLLRETMARVDGHDEQLEKVRLAAAEVRGLLQGAHGLLERVSQLGRQYTQLHDDISAIRTDIAVVLTLLKQDRS